MNMNKTANLAVGTTNKLIEARQPTWLSRNVRQVCDGGFGCRTMYLVTVACETSMQLTVDAGSAPQRVLVAHSLDEFTLFRRGSRATQLPVAGFPFPEHAEPLAVPADDCLGLNDDKGVLPAWPQARKENPEKTVERTKARPWSFPLEDRQLLAERDVFQL